MEKGETNNAANLSVPIDFCYNMSSTQMDSNNTSTGPSQEKSLNSKILDDLRSQLPLEQINVVASDAMNDYFMMERRENGLSIGACGTSRLAASSDDDNNFSVLDEEEQVLVWREPVVDPTPTHRSIPAFQVQGDFIDIDMLPESSSEHSEEDNSSESGQISAVELSLPANIQVEQPTQQRLNDLNVTVVVSAPAPEALLNVGEAEGQAETANVGDEAILEVDSAATDAKSDSVADLSIDSVSSLTLELLDRLNFHQRLRLLHRVLEVGEENERAELDMDVNLAAAWRCYAAEMLALDQPIDALLDSSTQQQEDDELPSGAATTSVSLESERVMIWSQHEAYIREVKQLAASACGPTAIINVLKALEIFVDAARVLTLVPVRLRHQDAPLMEYLMSRSCAGTTAEELVDGVHRLTDGHVVGRFFPLGPPPDMVLEAEVAGWRAGHLSQHKVHNSFAKFKRKRSVKEVYEGFGLAVLPGK